MSNPKVESPNWPVRLAVVVGVIVAGYFAVTYATRPIVTVAAVTKGISVKSVPGTVEVKAEFDRELKSAVAGRVKSSELEIGKRVNKNDVLVQIDTGDVDLDIERYKNEIVAAKKKVEVGSPLRAAVDNQKDDLDNHERMMKAGSYSPSEFAKEKRLYQQAVQNVELDETNNKLTLANWENSLKAKELEKSKMTITAPSDGVVTAVLARVGDLIDRNAPIANYIAVGRTVEGKLSEENFKDVRVGQKATVRFLTFGQDHYNAVITKVLPAADPLTQRYSIYLDVSVPPERPLVPGITGEITIVIDQRANALLVPPRALFGDKVYVLEDGKLALRQVKLGFESLNLVEILSGLKEGDRVVVEEQDRFHDGERVRSLLSPN